MGALFHRERTGEAADGRCLAPQRRSLGHGPSPGALAPVGYAVATTSRGFGRQEVRRTRSSAPTGPRTGASLPFRAFRGSTTGRAPAGRSAARTSSPTSDLRPTSCLHPTPAPPAPFSPPSSHRPRWPSGASGSPVSTANGRWRKTRSRSRHDPQVEANGYVLETVNACRRPVPPRDGTGPVRRNPGHPSVRPNSTSIVTRCWPVSATAPSPSWSWRQGVVA